MSSLVNWFLGLPAQHQISFGVAFIALVGVLTTAVSALASASLNALAVIKTRRLVNDHEERQWRRDKLWNAYSRAYEKAVESNILVREIFTIELSEFLDYAEGLIYRQHGIKKNKIKDVYQDINIQTLILKRSAMAERFQKNGNLRITNAEIMSDLKSSEVVKNTENLAAALEESINEVFDLTENLIEMIDAFSDQVPTSERLHFISGIIGHLQLFTTFEKYPHEAYRNLLASISKRMSEI